MSDRAGTPAPPTAAETLLAGCLADPELGDAVLGDLAEEWAERAADDGAPAADGWYRSQALRTAPHLLAARWRSAPPRELWWTLGRAGLALGVVLALAVPTVLGLWVATGGAATAASLGSEPHALALAAVLAGAVWALVAGFVVGVRSRTAPMADAALVAAGWILLTVVPAVAFPAPAGPPAWLYLAFPAALALATAAGGAAATLFRRRRGVSHPETRSSTLEAIMTTHTETTPFRRRAARVAVVTAVLLAVPLVAMQFTDEVVWTLSDFVFAGVLLAGTGLAFEAARTKVTDVTYRAAVGLALAAAFLLVWANGAVGIIGSEANPANFMYAGVLAVGLAGVFVARFEARGMSRAMVAIAGAQAMVTTIAIVYDLGAPWSGPFEIAATNGFWIALWLLSAGLFRRAAEGPGEVRAGAKAEG